MDASFCNLDPSALLRMTARDEGLWETLEQDCLEGFQQKTIKVFLTGPSKFARQRVNVRRISRVSGWKHWGRDCATVDLLK